MVTSPPRCRQQHQDEFGVEFRDPITQGRHLSEGGWRYHISSSIISPKPSEGDDRILIRHWQDESILVLLADGATGVGFGALAAECFIKVMSDHVTNFSRASVDIVHGLHAADRQIAGFAHPCDTTGVVLLVNGDNYMCASVGDSSAFMEASSGVVELTLGQRRKPRIGSGIQDPVVATGTISGTLLVATDGLCMTPAAVFALLKDRREDEHLAGLATLVTDCAARQGLMDDVAVVVVERHAPEHIESPQGRSIAPTGRC